MNPLRVSVYIAKKAEATIKESSARKEIHQALRAWEFTFKRVGSKPSREFVPVAPWRRVASSCGSFEE